MSAPRQFSLGDRFHVQYHEGDEIDEYELEVMAVMAVDAGCADGTVDVAKVIDGQPEPESEWWSILPNEWEKYWTLIDNPNNERSNQ